MHVLLGVSALAAAALTAPAAAFTARPAPRTRPAHYRRAAAVPVEAFETTAIAKAAFTGARAVVRAVRTPGGRGGIVKIARGVVEPLDLLTITTVWLLHERVLRALPRREALFERSLAGAVLPSVRLLSRILPCLYVTDAVCHVARATGAPVPSKLPVAVATVSWALLGGSTLCALKRFVLSRTVGYGEAGNRGRAEVLDRIGDAAIGSIAAMSCLEALSVQLGFALTSVLAFGGIGGVVLGLACQSPLANVVSGILLALTDPFTVGDEVDLGDGLEGYIESLGWCVQSAAAAAAATTPYCCCCCYHSLLPLRLTAPLRYQTRLRGEDNTIFNIPNCAFAEKCTANYSRMTHKRMTTTLHLRFEDVPRVGVLVARLRERLGAVAELDDDYDAGRPLRVYFQRYDDSGIDVEIEAHFKGSCDDAFFAWQENVLLAVGEEVAAAGCRLTPRSTTALLRGAAGAGA